MDRALDTLKALNTLEDEHGRTVVSLVKAEGFETWWFHQDLLYWHLIVPIEENLESISAALDGPPTIELSREATGLLERLRPFLEGSRLAGLLKPSQAQVRTPALGTRLRQAIVLALGWLALWTARARRLDTILTSVDQVSPGQRSDFRVAELDQELRRRGYRVAEYLFTTGEDSYRTPFTNIWRRRRLAVPFLKLAATLNRRPKLSPSPKPTLDQLGDSVRGTLLRASVHWALGRAVASTTQIESLKRLLRIHRPKRAVLLDNRNSLALSAACSTLGIPTLGFMHGQFNRYHPTLMAYGLRCPRKHGFDLYGVWSDYFVERLERGDLFDRSRVFASGPLRPSPGSFSLRKRKAAEAARVLLISESAGRQAELASYLERLINDERFSVGIKIRPGESPPHIAESGISLAGVPNISTRTIYEALEEADVVIGSYSSALFEAVLALRPVVILKTSFSYGHELAEDGFAGFAPHPRNVVEEVLRAAATGETELHRRRRGVWGEPANGVENLLETAERLLWPAPKES